MGACLVSHVVLRASSLARVCLRQTPAIHQWMALSYSLTCVEGSRPVRRIYQVSTYVSRAPCTARLFRKKSENPASNSNVANSTHTQWCQKRELNQPRGKQAMKCAHTYVRILSYSTRTHTVSVARGRSLGYSLSKPHACL